MRSGESMVRTLVCHRKEFVAFATASSGTVQFSTAARHIIPSGNRLSLLYILTPMSMKQIAGWALDTATQRGATYGDARIVNDRQRALATKNGKIGHAAESESFGIGFRVLVN